MFAIGTFALLAFGQGVWRQGMAMRAPRNAPVAVTRLQAKKSPMPDGVRSVMARDGISSDAKIPNHAGQYAAYLVKQLSDFQSGERRHATMSIMAEDLSADDRADIAAYFAGQKIMQGDGLDENPLARNLFENGDQSRNLPSCVSCHGDNGKGRIDGKTVYPVIGGQRRVYLRSQLVNWKLGDRKNSPDGVMNTVAKSLSDDEINALANYISGL